LDEALVLIKSLASIGIDGLIIQDPGLLELPLPPIPLFASTQMNNDSLEKILFLEKVGFSRVILPREMTLEEIRDVRSKTSIDLECFIQGALCVGYSGQCYLSYAIGGRSANRGVCAQPCRQRYSLVNDKGQVLAKNKHLLSLKDMNRADALEALIDAGVDSFKIEGRLKDVSYVKNTVGFYRKTLDAILSRRKDTRSSSGETTLHFTPNLNKTFSRGFTDFGLTSRRQNFGSIDTPKPLGEKLGAIKTVANDHVTLDTPHDLHNGDGVCFFDNEGDIKGVHINVVDGARIYPDKMTGLRRNLVLYRNHDHAFTKLLSSEKAAVRKIPVTFTLGETDDGFSLDVHDDDGNTARATIRAPKEPAHNAAQAEAAIPTQLSKLNDTIFCLRDVTHTFRQTYFLNLATLNKLRRDAIEQLTVARERNRPRPCGQILVNDTPYPHKTIDYRGNVLNALALAFYKRHGATVTEMAAESGLSMKGRCLMISKYCIKGELGLCKKEKNPLFLVDEKGSRYRLTFDCASCRICGWKGSGRCCG
jgi:putative protease